jgi:hypothetical protein
LFVFPDADGEPASGFQNGDCLAVTLDCPAQLRGPRNDATHGGHLLTDEQAQTAVDIATGIVEAAYPLASLLPTQAT